MNNINEYKAFLQNNCTTAWGDHGIFAAELVKGLNAKVTLDLGVDEGYSTFSFAAYNVGKVYGVDCFEGDPLVGSKDMYTKNLELQKIIEQKYGINNIEFIKGYFDDVAKTWDKQIDVLHIDGFHSFEACANDFLTWVRFVSESSVILFHDIDSYYDQVGEFFFQISGYKVLRTQSAGLGIVTNNKEVLHFVRELSKKITG